jgi:hypothetical protein
MRLQTFQRLLKAGRYPADGWLFVRIFAFAAITPLLMRLNLPRLEPWLTPQTIPPADPIQIAKIIRFTDHALRMGRPLLQVKCLTRGVTLYYFLNRAGLEVSLCFGVEAGNDQFAAHCWLVKDGVPFSEPHDPRLVYTPLYTMPRAASSIPATIARAPRR